MKYNYNIWSYDKLLLFRDRLYNSGITEENLTGKELAIRSGDDKKMQFFFEAKVGKCKYLIPSFLVEENKLPIIVSKKAKIGVKGKAYYLVYDYESLKVKPQRCMTYREMINVFLNVEHDEPELFILAKIINHCAFTERINVEILTHPGWLKTSMLVCYGMLLGHCHCVNKPSYAKLKLFLRDEVSTRVIGLDEINEIEDKDGLDLKSYIETTCDFRSEWINPKKASEGVNDKCRTDQLSNFLFYNFPKSDDENPRTSLRYFNKHLGHPKINRRLFSLLFDGGSEEIPAMKSKIRRSQTLTDDEYDLLLRWVKTALFYDVKKNRDELRQKLNIKRNKKLKNTTWDTNFETICNELALYCYTQEEYDHYETLLYDSHKKYWNYIMSLKNEENLEVIKETIK